MITLLNQKSLINVPKEPKVGNKKTITRLLLELGYHHCWGYFINNEDKSIRVTVRNASKSKKTHITVGYYNMYSGQSINVNDITNTDDLNVVIREAHNKAKSIWKK